jgi:hypothetical protein
MTTLQKLYHTIKAADPVISFDQQALEAAMERIAGQISQEGRHETARPVSTGSC